MIKSIINLKNKIMYKATFYLDFNDKNPTNLQIYKTYEEALEHCRQAAWSFSKSKEKINHGYRAKYDDRHWIVLYS